MTEIRSFRTVFELERRIYRVDRLRLNPGGIPVRGLVYFLVLLSGGLVVGHLPVLNAVARALPWYVSDVALPAASASLLTMVRIEGRPFHVAVQALLFHGFGPRRLVGWRACRAGDSTIGLASGSRWWPPDILFLPDGSDRVVRRLRYRGSGAVLVSVDHSLEGPDTASRCGRLRRLVPGSELRLHQGGDEGREVVVVLARRTCLRTG